MTEQLETIDRILNSGDIRKAEITIAKMLRSELDADIRAQLLVRRSRARLLGGRPDDALEEIQTVFAIQPSFEEMPEVKTLLGDIYFSRFILAEIGFADRNDADLALKYYEDIINRDPHFKQRGWVFYQRGRIYLSEDRVEEAIADFEEGLQKDNNPPYLHAYCHERQGFIYFFEKRQPEIALQHFDDALSVYPAGENAAWLVQVHISRSRVLREIGDYENALDAASQALTSLDPSAADFRQTLTEAHLAVGEVLALLPNREAEAIDHLLQFLQTSKRPLGVDVTWSRVYETLGNLSLKLDRYEQAIEAYQASLNYNPYHPWEVNLHYQIARCYYRMRAYERVIASMEKMRHTAQEEQQPITDYRVFNILANAYFALENYQEAAYAYRIALNLAPSSADNLDKIATYLRFSEELAIN